MYVPRGRALAGTLVAVVVLLAGCGDSADRAAPADDRSTPTAHNPGVVTAEIGQPVEIVENDVHIATVTVTGIEVDPTSCDNPLGEAPERGHWVLIDLTYETTAKADAQWYVNMFELKIIGSDGKTETANPAITGLDCHGQYPPMLGPGEAADGQLLLDSAYDAGTLVYQPISTDDTRYEWTFGRSG